MSACLLFTLPRELRDMIWELLVRSEQPLFIVWTGGRLCAASNTGNLSRPLSTCRQMYTECGAMLYSANTFEMNQNPSGHSILPDFAALIGRRHSQKLRKVAISSLRLPIIGDAHFQIQWEFDCATREIDFLPKRFNDACELVLKRTLLYVRGPDLKIAQICYELDLKDEGSSWDRLGELVRESIPRIYHPEVIESAKEELVRIHEAAVMGRENVGYTAASGAMAEPDWWPEYQGT